MKAIGNIFLVWRKGKGSRRTVVGVIKNNASLGVRFSYIPEGVEKAKKYGFTMYEGFPDLEKEYSENVLDIFGQRIMRSDRNDIDDFFKFWQIDKKFKEDNFYMLAYTQGFLPTDNFEFLAEFNPIKDLSFITEISGLSKLNLPVDTLKVGDNLKYSKECENKHDECAISLFCKDVFVGYIKLVHNKVFYKKSKSGLKVTVHHIEKNGKINRVFLKVSTNIK